tara:strand:+ start:592 stop:2034 length:1443 start_codon:yes stop_codon:yes gene_type:complete
MPVNTPRQEYTLYTLVWKRLRDCFGGRDKIMAAGELYTPVLPGADRAGNEAYLTRGNWFGALRRTVIGLTGGIFQKDPIFEVPVSDRKWLKDVTLTGTKMSSFALTATEEVLLMARYGVLIDMAEEEQTSEYRPYLIGFKTENIVNWSTTTLAGDQVLTLLVLRESLQVPTLEDPFEYESVDQFRECRLLLPEEGEEAKPNYVQQLWRQENTSKEWMRYGPPKIALRRGEPLTFIPFVFLGPTQPNAQLSTPPLLDLADINLAHWRNSCDHEQGLHIVAAPTPFVSGMKRGDGDTSKVNIGPSTVWLLDKDGKAGMVEFTGAGLKALVEAMDIKQRQMAVVGAKLLEEQASTSETATAVLTRHAGEHATLRTIASSVEQGFEMVLQIMSWWMGIEEKPVDVPVNVQFNKAFVSVKAKPEEIKVALTALQGEEISFATFWEIMVEGGWAREGITAEEERQEISRQAPVGIEPEEIEVVEGL